MSFVNCCGCINTNEGEMRGKDMKKRYKTASKPQKKPERRSSASRDQRDGSFLKSSPGGLEREEDDSKFISVQTSD